MAGVVLNTRDMELPRERKERIEAERLREKELRALEVKLRRSVRSDITASGVMSVRYKLEYIESRPDLKEVDGLSHNTIVRVYNEAIKKLES